MTILFRPIKFRGSQLLMKRFIKVRRFYKNERRINEWYKYRGYKKL